MKSSKAAIIVIVFAIAFFAIMWTSSRNLTAIRVEVCMEYQGRSACRTAAGPSKEQAERTARDNACALIASGMTDSIACQNTQPKSVTVK
jgi:hypothetical protein